VRQQEGRGRRLRGGVHEVRADHHDVARQPVGECPADQQEEDQRHGLRRKDDPEVGTRARQVEHRERERDRGEGAACERDEPPGEQQSELALAERPEPAERLSGS